MRGNARSTCFSCRRVFQEYSLEDDNVSVSKSIDLLPWSRASGIKVMRYFLANYALKIMRTAQYFYAKFLMFQFTKLANIFLDLPLIQNYPFSKRHKRPEMSCWFAIFSKHFSQRSGGSIYCENVLYLRKKKIPCISQGMKKRT